MFSYFFGKTKKNKGSKSKVNKNTTRKEKKYRRFKVTIEFFLKKNSDYNYDPIEELETMKDVIVKHSKSKNKDRDAIIADYWKRCMDNFVYNGDNSRSPDECEVGDYEYTVHPFFIHEELEFARVEKEFNLQKHLEKMDPKENVLISIIYNQGKIISAKWLPGHKLKFIVKMNEPMTVNELMKDLLRNSLEDGPYEGDPQWIITLGYPDISDYAKKYFKYPEYGLIDYRKKENIKIIPL